MIGVAAVGVVVFVVVDFSVAARFDAIVAVAIVVAVILPQAHQVRSCCSLSVVAMICCCG